MDQETAKSLFEGGATLVLLDFPENSEFGIDYNSWRTGPKFRGVKMIPPGIHFIYYSASDKEGNIGFRSGFFYIFKTKEILLKKWNKQTESIELNLPIDKEEIERIQINKHDLDRFLAPYPYDEYKKWISLSNYLNETMVNRLVPLTGEITSAAELVGEKFTRSRVIKPTVSTSASSSTDVEMKSSSNESEKREQNLNKLFQAPKSLIEAENMLPKMTENDVSRIRFTNILKYKYPQGSTSTQITAHSIDMSYYLENLLASNYESNANNVLCELQFAFICFLIGYVYDAFEQWKLIVNLLCNSDREIRTNPTMYLNFIQIFYFQLKEIPDDFFADVVTKNNFLVMCLHNLFDNIYNVNIEEEKGFGVEDNQRQILNLKEKSNQFKLYLKETFNFDFNEEPDEYAPTICE